MIKTEIFMASTIAGACMLALGIALGGGIVPVQLLLVGFGLVGICATFAYSILTIVQDIQGQNQRENIVQYGGYAYRIESPEQDEIIEAYPEHLPTWRDNKPDQVVRKNMRGPSWFIVK